MSIKTQVDDCWREERSLKKVRMEEKLLHHFEKKEDVSVFNIGKI